jgi:PHD/YefM family antitoxin component YafN of YafNO toxin-antitoxin module
MQTMTATTAKKNFDEILENIQNDSEPIFVVGDEKAMIMVSAQYWNCFEETAYLSKNPKMRKKIIKGLKTPVSECCVPESEINF